MNNLKVYALTIDIDAFEQQEIQGERNTGDAWVRRGGQIRTRRQLQQHSKLLALTQALKPVTKENHGGKGSEKGVDLARTEGKEDEMQALDKLSYMNAGARYELLSINQQLLNFDLKFKVSSDSL